MRSRVSRCLVQYYTALRLSAGAAMLLLPFEAPEPRTPVVRASDMTGPSGFDRREMIVQAGRVSIVTMPHETERAPAQPAFRLN
ncbi:MAG TPA: hypothetical protein VFV93_18060 [Thermomicrobiales bacterium]|nr:hypothetical protein [Thermomicrobiales bacterium]